MATPVPPEQKGLVVNLIDSARLEHSAGILQLYTIVPSGASGRRSRPLVTGAGAECAVPIAIGPRDQR